MTSVGSVSSGFGSASVTAISGLRAATLRLDVAAHNIANASTDGFVPGRVVQSDLPQAGVRATVEVGQRQDRGASTGQPSGEGGSSSQSGPTGRFPPAPPDVGGPSGTSITAEIVNTLLAKAAFVASLRVLRQDNQMSRALFEMLG
jgi:flagellar hook-associated protein FlgK